jgi:hypothetical protein
MPETPVLFLIFNRPELTQQSFDRIKQQKPAKLYIAADGPRQDAEGDQEKCALAKKIVADGVDWPCEVKTLYRENNLGCGKAVSEAINWFFTHEEQGIILEDDCLADDSFFEFCNSLLAKYSTEREIMMVTGCSFQPRSLDSYSYYFSSYIHVWGWATWKRAWDLYDFNLKGFTHIEGDRTLKTRFPLKRERKTWLRNVAQAIDGTINTWDYQWMYTIWKNGGLSIVSWKNLVSNIGYGTDATHTKAFDQGSMALPTHELHSISHPDRIKANKKADKIIRYQVITFKTTPISILREAKNRLLKLFKLR